MPVRHQVLVGPEPLRRHLVARILADAPEPVTRIDAAERPDELIGMLQTAGGLFGAGTILVSNLADLSAADLKKVASLLDGAVSQVVATSDSLTAASEKVIGKAATVEKIPTSRGRALAGTYQRIAGALGLQLSPANAARLESHTGTEYGRAVAVLTCVHAMGSDTVTDKHIDALAGRVDEPGMPWTLMDALERGDVARATDELKRVEAIPTLAYLAKRWTTAALLAEGSSPEEASVVVGNLSDSAVAQARRLGTKTTVGGRNHVISVLANADRHAKSGNPAAGLALAAAAIRLALTRSVG